MFKVTHQWNKLKTCVVGSAYPPELFDFIKDVALRKTFETLAIETEEDIKKLVTFLESFGINVIRPTMPENFNEFKISNGYIAPPIAARDFMTMIDDKLYYPGLPNLNHAWMEFAGLKQIDSRDALQDEQLRQQWIEFQKQDKHVFDQKVSFYEDIFTLALQQGNEVVASPIDYMNSSFITRLGDRMIVGTQNYHDDHDGIKRRFSKMFPSKEIHVASSEGHSDGCFAPVSETLIISAYDTIDYNRIFPDAEVVSVPAEITLKDDKFKQQMMTAEHKWFIEGMERNKDLVEMVDYYFNSWIGNVNETAFMVNILMLDKKNALCSTENKQVRQAMKRHGIELHVTPFRHRWFWDTGIHCLTQDLDRE
jgi:N-dimethylarginine dimethylaminohydrolase